MVWVEGVTSSTESDASGCVATPAEREFLIDDLLISLRKSISSQKRQLDI